MGHKTKHVHHTSSRQFTRIQSDRHRNARIRLGFELLEQRQLLAADLEPVRLEARDISQPPIAPLTWFESIQRTQRIPLQSLANVDPSLPDGVAGPLPGAVGEWIVQLKKASAETIRNLAAADSLLDDPDNDFSIISGLGSEGLILVRGQGGSRADIEASLARNAAVDSFHLNQLIEGQATSPNDPEFVAGLLPGLDKIDATNAWDATRGSLSTVVGVVDTGIDSTHPDLYLNIWINQGELPPKYLDEVGAKLTDIDGDGLITFYDLNNVTRAATSPYAITVGGFASGPNASFVNDLNNNGRIDAQDLLADANWADGRDTDNNGFFDDFFGVNFRAGGSDPFAANDASDPLGHGTHVAGTIGAIGGNGTGIVGINWQTSLMSLRILDNNNQGDSGAAIRAINYATEMRQRLQISSSGRVIAGANVRVLNNSWGQPGGYETSLGAAIADSYGAGILFVAAAGNGNILGNGVDNDRTPFYPASYTSPNVIAVGASDGTNHLATFSNFGKTSVDILAPGVGVRSTLPGGGYGNANGTSMATPHISGSAALIFSALPQSTVEDVRAALLTSTIPFNVAVGIDAKSIVSSGGQLNVAAALASDVYAPSVELISAPDITTPGNATTEIVVRYSHPVGIDALTLSDANIIVERDWGPRTTLPARLDRSSIIQDATSATATYIISAPGGAFDPLDFGNYKVSAAPRSVFSSTRVVANRGGTFGSFRVEIEDVNFIYVNATLDTPDALAADSEARDANGNVSLRAAIQEANRRAVVDPATETTILLEAGLYKLILDGAGEDAAELGDLDVAGKLRIIGDSRSNVRILAANRDRAFHALASSELRLQRIAVSGGETTADGGGILVEGRLDAYDVELTRNVAARGAAIAVLSTGYLFLSGNSAIELNRSINTDVPGLRRVGGAVFFDAFARGQIDGATIASNITDGITQLDSGSSIATRDQFAIDIFNTTISSNTENGIYTLGAVNVEHATIANNGRFGINFYTSEAGFPLLDDGELIRIKNSILIQNVTDSITLQTPRDISQGFNLFQDDFFGDLSREIFKKPSDIGVRTSGGIISPLDFYGTSTRHHPLLVNSPAVDKATQSLSMDQFGLPRPIDGDGDFISLPDIGAIEVGTDQMVTGVVFDDRNQNGERDNDELGIAGQFVFVDRDTDGIYDDGEPFVTSSGDDPRTPTVNESGSYLFTQTTGDTLTLVVVASENWVTSEPGIRRVSETIEGIGGNGLSASRLLVFDDQVTSVPAAISETGRFINYFTTATNLQGTDIDRGRDTRRVTSGILNPRIDSQGNIFYLGSVNGCSQHYRLSLEGTTTALGEPLFCNQFQSAYDGLDLSGDGSVIAYYQSLVAGPVIQMDTPEGSLLVEDNFSSVPQIDLSRDGSVLAYNAFNGRRVVRSFNRTSNQTTTVSLTPSGQIPNGDSRFPAVNADGTIVVFESDATDLVPSDGNFSSDIFLARNGEIRRISLDYLGAERSGNSSRPTISSDGRFVAFSTIAALEPNDGNSRSDVYVYSIETDEIRLVTRVLNGSSADGESDVPVISGDGRYITFTSNATNLVANDENGFSDLFLATNPFLGVLENGFGNVISVSQDRQANANFALIARPGDVSGAVYDDSVANGVFDIGEIGLSDVTVFIDLNRDGSLDEGEPFTTTGTDGRFVFSDLASDSDYSISVIGPVGFVQVPFDGNRLSQDFYLPPGSSLTQRDFAFRVSASTGQSGGSGIEGRLFDDKNGNGSFDAGVDLPIVGGEVYLDASNFGVRDTNEPRVLTDNEGLYSFVGLGSLSVAVSTLLAPTLVHVSPLGSDFALETFPLFNALAPFGNPQSISRSDFNLDGFQDVAVALGEGNKLSIRFNNGAGGFVSDQIDIDLGSAGAGPTSLVVGQFDNDAKLDVALTANYTGNVTVLLNFNAVTKAFTSRSYVKVGGEPLDLVAGQFGGNAKPDLVVVNKADNSVQLLTNDGGGVFTPGAAIASGGNVPVSLVAGNFSGDASLDVAVVHAVPLNTGTTSGGVTVLTGDGAGKLVKEAAYYQVGGLPIDSVTGDFNGDSRTDVAVANFNSNSISILLCKSDGTFRVQTAILGTASGAFDIAVGDIDNDGDIDVIASNLKDRNLSIFRNIGLDSASGDVLFEPLENVGLGQFSLAQRMPLVVANFDNDTSGPGGTGTLDIVTIPQQADSLHVLKNRLVNGARRVALTGLNIVTGQDFIIRSAVLPPSFNAIANPAAIVEDDDEQSIDVLGIVKGRATGPALQFTATSSNTSLIANPVVDFINGSAQATIRYTPKSDANGTTVITVRAVDAGADQLFGGANSDDGIFERSLTVTVLPVNDPPTMTVPSVITVLQNAGAQTIANYVTGIGKGGANDEAGQTLSAFSVTADTSFFTAQPAISNTGTLTFTPNSTKAGVVQVTVTLSDNGGKARGGSNLTTRTFSINISVPTTFAIAATSASKPEGNSGTTPFTFTVTRSGLTTTSSTVNYAVTGSATSAAAASDFSGSVLPSGTLTFAAGQTSKVITINVVGDTAFEPNEGFVVSLNTPSAGTITNAFANGTILNDDSAPPVIGSIGSTVTYTENAGRVLVFSAVTITDADTTLFTNGTLTITNTNGQATDSLAIVPTSLVTVSGANVLYMGTVIGSFTGGTAKTPLVFTFNNQTNAARMQLVLRAIGFSDSSENPITTARTISVEATDGVGGKSVLQSKLVNVVSVNDVPVIGSNGSTVTYTENAARALVFSGATFSDVDTALFTSGTLTITNTNGQATDSLAVVPTSLITVSGTNVLYLGTVIGNFTGGTAKTPLVFTFNNQTNAGRLQLVLRAVGFADSSENPITTARSISVEATDGAGGKSALQSMLVNVVSVNDAPVIATIGSDVTYNKNAPRVLVFSTAIVTDVDTTLFTGGTLTVTNTNGQATDTLAIVPTSLITISGANVLYLGTMIGSFTGGAAKTPLVFTFNNQANAGRIQLVLRAIGFADSSSTPVTTARSVSVEVTDGSGGKSVLQSKLVNVVA